MANNINKRVGNAAKWSIFTEITIKLISPITNMILARILTPEAFGVVATVIMIISFTDIFTDAGFQKYIVQHRFSSKDDEDLSICVAFWTNFAISIVLWFIIFIFSGQISTAVGNPGLGKVIYIGALLLPLTSFSSIQTAIFRKSLNYKSISFARITVKFIPLVVTIPLALLGLSYWSIIVGNIVGELCNAVILTVMSEWKPKFRYSFEKLKIMFQFCIWTLLETLSSWLVTNIGIFVIGRLFNEYYLGIYKIATTTVAQIISLISGATISVLFSALSELQNEEKQYVDLYKKFLRLIGILVVPLGFGIFVYKDVVRNILLGSQWTDADLLIGMWGFVLAESVIFNDMSGAVILSKGRPKMLFVSNMMQALLMIPALYLSSITGFKVLVIVTCVVRVQLPVTQTIMAQMASSIKFMTVVKTIKWYILSAIVMSVAGIAMRNFSSATLWTYLSIVICIVLYFGFLYIVPEERVLLRRYLNLIKVKLIKKQKNGWVNYGSN